MELTQSYRSTHRLYNDSSSDGECSNSDDDSSWKRSKKQTSRLKSDASITSMDIDNLSTTAETVNQTSRPQKRKVNNVWCAVLQEQSLSEDLGRFGMNKKPISLQERSCESYDFTRKALDPRDDLSSEVSENKTNIFCGEDTVGKTDIFCDDSDINKKPTEESTNEKVNSLENKKSKKKFTHREEEEIRKISKYIIRKLNEPKHTLIHRIVRIIGVKDALEVLRMTENVEEEGGMMVVNQSRRRTPGGVFIQLLKTFPKANKEQIDEIFAEEKKVFEMKRKLQKKSRRKKLRQKAAQAKEKKMECEESCTNTSNSANEDSSSPLPVMNSADENGTEQVQEVHCDAIDVQITEENIDKEEVQDDEIEEGEIQD